MDSESMQYDAELAISATQMVLH